MVFRLKKSESLPTLLKDAGNRLVIIDFFAEWCGPCKFIEPKFQEFSEKYSNAVFIKVNVDECQEASDEYNISSLPTFIFIKNGQKVDEFTGANESKLVELIEKHYC